MNRTTPAFCDYCSTIEGESELSRNSIGLQQQRYITSYPTPPYHSVPSHSVPSQYVAIELEALGVAWLMEKFHYFLYASHFTLEIDQKPLEATQQLQ